MKYSIPEEVTIIFDNGSIHDYHFTIKELAEEFELQFTSLGENTEKYITFSVVIESQVKRIGKNEKEFTEAISYRLQFIDNGRFIASSL